MICGLLPSLGEICANEKQNKHIYMKKKKKRAPPALESNLHAAGLYARSAQLGPWTAICFN
jgi:hypothetical protein